MYYPNSVSWDKTRKGGLRRLRLGEINLASSLYQYSIFYNKVWVHYDSYLPLNLQPGSIGMAPNGEMWFRDRYEEDFSAPKKDRVEQQHLFMHEMMHVWQHQHGMWVRTRGLFSRFADYSYRLEKNNLLDYSLEQQATIVSDYWLLKSYGFNNYAYLIDYKEYTPAEPDLVLLKKYEKVLGGFPA
ncbi:type IV secretion protein Rhs [Enterobacteriaceae bacterium H11S18]|uniref:type IV secretion protein Rhs n=1 Tax=Dryocola clanedunensis TaxID=2925396 RepID=UPI0022F0F645|nr:type IV secretion protein Rhs [Dryocola clanedunensis]MCT4704895.1 type IV secretion protein Rhs [Dryocola clanedunensis]MCT4712045.1 type IV secretion protein Rhs [Dryocola clanedunensis]